MAVAQRAHRRRAKPGGPPDLIARFIAEPLERALGVPVVVENRPGASGIIGVTSVARAAPDGYTLLIGTLSTHALVPHASANVTYDPLRDFQPVINLFRSIKVLWVNPALPVKTMRDWIDYATARPGRLNYSSGGVGSSNHVDMEVVNAALGIDAVHVPYNGPSAGIAAVAGGDAQAMIVSIGTACRWRRPGACARSPSSMRTARGSFPMFRRRPSRDPGRSISPHGSASSRLRERRRQSLEESMPRPRKSCAPPPPRRGPTSRVSKSSAARRHRLPQRWLAIITAGAK
jgi:hypothetical protein